MRIPVRVFDAYRMGGASHRAPPFLFSLIKSKSGKKPHQQGMYLILKPDFPILKRKYLYNIYL